MVRNWAKNQVNSLPYSVGKYMGKMPFFIKVGTKYLLYNKTIKDYETLKHEDKKKLIVKKLQKIVNYAQKTFSSYRELYGKTQLKIRSIEDFKNLPVIDKEFAKKLEKEASGYRRVNTGGTSGEPLALYLDNNYLPREWSHMHRIWRKVGYKPSKTIITILGKNIENKITKFNASNNEFLVNPYKPEEEQAKHVIKLLKNYPIHYMQGYPSSLYVLLLKIDEISSSAEKSIIKNKIKALLLSSEMPASNITTYFGERWKFKHLSWYGHTEMLVLAVETNEPLVYTPLMTYGFAENVDGMLCGTTYENTDMPLIRYQTGDNIKTIEEKCGILEEFKITSGRKGDYVVDKYRNRVSLTALIFGRHHKIFDFAKFVQVKQKEKGQIEIRICTDSRFEQLNNEPEKYFDLENLENFKISFVWTDKPFKTKRGKVPLKIIGDKD